eukprot:CAMPEP_0196783476 /NCGR_PEP_ID=MMETSP1104-20130614/13857_1 /TAXON_ID=33652 /ORGANISM="Cafeteria sp., Strain Caron Lab Isolate" /LENGTH=226 /DNA_ID=CAMNT_0042153725 /DNA_START=25 /DNA_END=701 /DNA_ORIENTATION=-
MSRLNPNAPVFAFTKPARPAVPAERPGAPSAPRRRVYSRHFLLQMRHFCTMKPAALPGWLDASLQWESRRPRAASSEWHPNPTRVSYTPDQLRAMNLLSVGLSPVTPAVIHRFDARGKPFDSYPVPPPSVPPLKPWGQPSSPHLPPAAMPPGSMGAPAPGPPHFSPDYFASIQPAPPDGPRHHPEVSQAASMMAMSMDYAGRTGALREAPAPMSYADLVRGPAAVP